MTGSPQPQLLTLSARASTQSARTVEFMGRTYRVIPAVLVQGQVLVNNLGRMFLPAEVITPAWAEMWNGIPVIVGPHPSINGTQISGRNPAILDARGVGHIFNAFVDNASDGTRRLRGEVWIDTARLSAVQELARIFERLDAGAAVELSTGFEAALEGTSGTWHGETYDRVLRPMNADHLIITAELTGACSVAHGCGLGVENTQPTDAPLQILESARRPTFTGVEDTEWQSPTLDEFRTALGLTTTPRLSDLPAEARQRIAAHSLLGNPNAKTLDELAFALVVNPRTGCLNTRAVRAVMQGRGGLGTDKVALRTRDSAVMRARLLLDEVEHQPPGAVSRAIQTLAAGAKNTMSLFNRKPANLTAWEKTTAQNLERLQAAYQTVPETDQQHAAMLQDALQDKFGGAERRACVTDVYSSTTPRQVIFFMMTPNGAVPPGMEYFRCDYEETSTGVFTFTEPVRVLRMVSYEPLQDSMPSRQTTAADNTTSAQLDRPCGCKGATHPVEDVEMMTNEDKSSLIGEIVTAVAEKFATQLAALKTDIDAAKASVQNTATETVTAALTAIKEQVATLATAVNAERDAERQALVQFLSSNDRTAFTAPELEAMPLNTLQKLSETLGGSQTYYGARGGPRSTAGNTDEAEFALPVPYFAKKDEGTTK